MAEKKNKPKFKFKDLPVACRVLRIVTMALLSPGMIW